MAITMNAFRFGASLLVNAFEVRFIDWLGEYEKKPSYGRGARVGRGRAIGVDLGGW